MGIPQHINADQFSLFHGSTHWFGEGEIVEPTVDRLYGGEPKAYASASMEAAGDYAMAKASGIHAMSDTFNGDVPREHRSHQGTLFAPVYGVSHRGGADNIQAAPSGDRNAVANSAGFDVDAIAGYRRTDNMADTFAYHNEPGRWL